jgi:acetyl-CoA acetyltransferase family protein
MDLVRQTVDDVLRRTGINAGCIDRVLIECSDAVGDQLETAGRLSWPVDGVPTRVPPTTVGRWCGTGQQVLHLAAHGIVRGTYDAVLVLGVESMPNGQSPSAQPSAESELRAMAELPPRILAAERLAAKWGIERQRLDEYAVRSHQRAAEVASAGEFDAEIVAIESGRPGHPLKADQTIDRELTIEALRALRPTLLDPIATSRHPGISWSITTGNAAQPSIGTAAVLLMSKPRAEALKLRPRAHVRNLSVARGDATLPLLAPLRATEKVLAATKLSLAQIDHVEVDEEFACVPLAWTSEFNISEDLFNPRGGSLALGNPRACGGLRQLTTMLSALEATGGRVGLQTMSSQNGNAYASLIECG